jgi:hypothetical protein
MVTFAACVTLFAATTIQTSEIAMTPPEALPLGGYTARMGKVSDPGGETLYARTVVIRQGSTSVAIVSAEMLTIPASLTREVRSKIPPEIKLFLAATHTHCAPDSQMLNDRMTMPIPGIAPFRRRWLDWYSARIAEGIHAALRADAKAMDTFAVTRWSVALNSARRKDATPDGAAVRLDLGEVPITHYTAHPTIFDDKHNQPDGDWPGAVAQATGGMVLNGAIGDVAPGGPARGPEARIRAFVERLKTPSRRSEVSRFDSGELSWKAEPIELGPTVPHPEFAKAFGVAQPLAELVVRNFAPPVADVSVVKLGGLAIVGIPGEPTSALARQIQAAARAAGLKDCLVVSNVNAWIGYILEPGDYDRGGYEATLAFHGREAGGRVVEAATSALRKT